MKQGGFVNSTGKVKSNKRNISSRSYIISTPNSFSSKSHGIFGECQFPLLHFDYKDEENLFAKIPPE